MASVNITIRMRPKLIAIHESRRYEKAPKFLREFIARHSKSPVENVKISTDINRYLNANTTNRYKPIKLTFTKTADRVDVDLSPELKKMMQRPVQTVSSMKPVAKNDSKKPATAAKPEQKKADTSKAPKQQLAPTNATTQLQDKAAAASKQKAPKQKQEKPADAAAPQA